MPTILDLEFKTPTVEQIKKPFAVIEKGADAAKKSTEILGSAFKLFGGETNVVGNKLGSVAKSIDTVRKTSKDMKLQVDVVGKSFRAVREVAAAATKGQHRFANALKEGRREGGLTADQWLTLSGQAVALGTSLVPLATQMHLIKKAALLTVPALKLAGAALIGYGAVKFNKLLEAQNRALNKSGDSLKILAGQMGRTRELWRRDVNAIVRATGYGSGEIATQLRKLSLPFQRAGYNVEQLKNFTVGLNLTMREYSHSSEEATGITTRLTQALDSNKLSASLINEIYDKSPDLFDRLAEALLLSGYRVDDWNKRSDRTIDSMIKIAKEGKLSSDVMRNFGKVMIELGKDAGSGFFDMEESWQSLGNKVVAEAGTMNEYLHYFIAAIGGVVSAIAKIHPKVRLAAGAASVGALVWDAWGKAGVGSAVSIGGAIQESVLYPMDLWIDKMVVATAENTRWESSFRNAFTLRVETLKKASIDEQKYSQQRIEAAKQHREDVDKITELQKKRGEIIKKNAREADKASEEEAGSTLKHIENITNEIKKIDERIGVRSKDLDLSREQARANEAEGKSWWDKFSLFGTAYAATSEKLDETRVKHQEMSEAANKSAEALKSQTDEAKLSAEERLELNKKLQAELIEEGILIDKNKKKEEKRTDAIKSSIEFREKLFKLDERGRARVLRQMIREATIHDENLTKVTKKQAVEKAGLDEIHKQIVITNKDLKKTGDLYDKVTDRANVYSKTFGKIKKKSRDSTDSEIKDLLDKMEAYEKMIETREKDIAKSGEQVKANKKLAESDRIWASNKMLFIKNVTEAYVEYKGMIEHVDVTEDDAFTRAAQRLKDRADLELAMGRVTASVAEERMDLLTREELVSKETAEQIKSANERTSVSYEDLTDSINEAKKATDRYAGAAKGVVSASKNIRSSLKATSNVAKQTTNSLVGVFNKARSELKTINASIYSGQLWIETQRHNTWVRDQLLRKKREEARRESQKNEISETQDTYGRLEEMQIAHQKKLIGKIEHYNQVRQNMEEKAHQAWSYTMTKRMNEEEELHEKMMHYIRAYDASAIKREQGSVRQEDSGQRVGRIDTTTPAPEGFSFFGGYRPPSASYSFGNRNLSRNISAMAEMIATGKTVDDFRAILGGPRGGSNVATTSAGERGVSFSDWGGIGGRQQWSSATYEQILEKGMQADPSLAVKVSESLLASASTGTPLYSFDQAVVGRSKFGENATILEKMFSGYIEQILASVPESISQLGREAVSDSMLTSAEEQSIRGAVAQHLEAGLPATPYGEAFAPALEKVINEPNGLLEKMADQATGIWDVRKILLEARRSEVGGSAIPYNRSAAIEALSGTQGAVLTEYGELTPEAHAAIDAYIASQLEAARVAQQVETAGGVGGTGISGPSEQEVNQAQARRISLLENELSLRDSFSRSIAREVTPIGKLPLAGGESTFADAIGGTGQPITPSVVDPRQGGGSVPPYRPPPPSIDAFRDKIVVEVNINPAEVVRKGLQSSDTDTENALKNSGGGSSGSGTWNPGTVTVSPPSDQGNQPFVYYDT